MKWPYCLIVPCVEHAPVWWEHARRLAERGPILMVLGKLVRTQKPVRVHHTVAAYLLKEARQIPGWPTMGPVPLRVEKEQRSQPA